MNPDTEFWRPFSPSHSNRFFGSLDGLPTASNTSTLHQQSEHLFLKAFFAEGMPLTRIKFVLPVVENYRNEKHRRELR